MTYGVFQEFFATSWTLHGSQSLTGIIGTTQNGVMYLSMPFLFALFTRRWAHRRQAAASCGVVLACASFVLSSFSTEAWHLVLTQGVLAAIGCALIYSPMTLSLGEWWNSSNRAVAYAVTLSCKNIVGSVCPFLIRALLNKYDFRITMQIWAGVVALSSVLAIWLIPTHPATVSTITIMQRPRTIPWHFLGHQTIYVYSIAIVLQSCGYGIPQTYLAQYASEVIMLSQGSATLLLTLFNLPGIASSTFFGYLTDNKRFAMSAATVTAISATATSLSAFTMWGLTEKGSSALLMVFSITFGFFAGGYSATWGGVLNDLEREAAANNEAVDSGMVYGMLNGARGIGYVVGGLVGVPLLRDGGITMSSSGYGSTYGKLILFTGLSTVFGGWGLLFKWKRSIVW